MPAKAKAASFPVVVLDVNFALPFSIFGHKPHGFILPVLIPIAVI